MKYPLHNLNEDDFENLINLLCREVLGTGVISFSKGSDGGKDGKFNGTANNYPDKQHPWMGKFIIQTKHTSKENASCSDREFKKIVQKEIPKVIKLKEKGEIDYYLLFTNRKRSGNNTTEEDIKAETTVETSLIAEEQIQDYLQQYPNVASVTKLNRLLMPLEFDEEDIKEVVLAISYTIKSSSSGTSSEEDFIKIDLERKNKINDLSSEYFNGSIKPNFENFGNIESFFKDPINVEIREVYDDIIDELRAQISINRNDYPSFQEIIEDICKKVTHVYKDELKGNKKLVRMLLHYMYCGCDIGKKE